MSRKDNTDATSGKYREPTPSQVKLEIPPSYRSHCERNHEQESITENEIPSYIDMGKPTDDFSSIGINSEDFYCRLEETTPLKVTSSAYGDDLINGDNDIPTNYSVDLYNNFDHLIKDDTYNEPTEQHEAIKHYRKGNTQKVISQAIVPAGISAEPYKTQYGYNISYLSALVIYLVIMPSHFMAAYNTRLATRDKHRAHPIRLHHNKFLFINHEELETTAMPSEDPSRVPQASLDCESNNNEECDRNNICNIMHHHDQYHHHDLIANCIIHRDTAMNFMPHDNCTNTNLKNNKKNDLPNFILEKNPNFKKTKADLPNGNKTYLSYPTFGNKYHPSKSNDYIHHDSPQEQDKDGQGSDSPGVAGL